ncbi:MAG TPA: Hsp70 family protein [Kofleriaceae bacterium]|nr:Hsp70 family protein [Kofleriaceae bacterium]
MPPAPIVGIDLGTTYTAIGVMTAAGAAVLPLADGSRALPSVVSFPRRAAPLVGAEARDRLATDPTRTIASPKRLLGRRLADREVQSYVGAAPYRTEAGDDGAPLLDVDGERYAMAQICGLILREVRAAAEQHLQADVERAVLTVPVSFDAGRARALETAARLAGLETVALIAEPNAAALAHRGLPGFGGLVGIYDFGGGTFDFSIVDVGRDRFSVVASAGDAWLGGDDIDAVIADAAANQFWRQHRVDLRKQAVEWQRLRFAAELTKRALSTAESAQLAVPEILRTAHGMVDLRLTLDRATLARAGAAIIRRTLDVCETALTRAGLRPSALHGIALCGGSSQMPAVRAAVERHFGIPLLVSPRDDQAVCLGAAIHAGLMQQHRASPIMAQRP